MSPDPSRERRPTSTPASVGRITDLITWSFANVDQALWARDGDPPSVLPFIEEQSDAFYWELHIEGTRPTRTDFLQRTRFARARPGWECSPDPVLDQLRRWYASGDTAERCHPSVWLEIDGPLTLARNPGRRQGVSICLDSQFETRRDGDRAPPAHSEGGLLELFAGLQASCEAEPHGTDVLARVRRTALRHSGWLRHLSVMRGRPGSPVKIYLCLPLPALANFLCEIEWPGDIVAAVHLAGLVCARSALAHLDLEILGDLSARIGFELFADPSPAIDPFRRTATRMATERRLLTSQQVAGLESWVGDVPRKLGGEGWPTRIRRWFDLKFVMQPRGGVELKAYLGFRTLESIL